MAQEIITLDDLQKFRLQLLEADGQVDFDHGNIAFIGSRLLLYSK